MKLRLHGDARGAHVSSAMADISFHMNIFIILTMTSIDGVTMQTRLRRDSSLEDAVSATLDRQLSEKGDIVAARMRFTIWFSLR